MMLYPFGHPGNFVVLCGARVGKYFSRNAVSCCTKCCIRLATPLLNMIKQHATMCNKCFMKCCTRLAHIMLFIHLRN